MGGGALVGFALAARWLAEGINPYRMARAASLRARRVFGGDLLQPLGSAELFFAGAALIGFGGGLFSVATLTAAMTLPAPARRARLALGAWGAAQATAAGLSIAIGGGIRDVVNGWPNGHLGEALANPATGYSVVYHLEIGFSSSRWWPSGRWCATATTNTNRATGKIGLADLPT
jgi:BCD family chlorophyll transporter-like MFS transporter